jgi:hypothetical protein
MNRNQIIVKTLEDMRGYEWSQREEFYRQSAEAEELDRYDRDTTIPELMKRLPDSDIMSCKDLDFPVECCDSCHYFYAHYDMHLVELPDARKAWICCAVLRALFHEPRESDYSQGVDLEEALGGGLRRQADSNQE